MWFLLAALLAFLPVHAQAQQTMLPCTQIPGSPFGSCQPVSATAPLPVKISGGGLNGLAALVTGNSGPNILGECSYIADNPSYANSNWPSDALPSLQTWLNNCYVQALNLTQGSEALDDQDLRNCVKAVLPRGNFQTSSPLIIPQYVCADFEGTIVRLGQNGVATASYSGDTSSNANKNLEQPAVIIPVGAHVLHTLSIYGNSNGADNGSGWLAGKNWRISGSGAAAAQAVGTGYTAGDVLQLGQPSKAPYYAAQITVDTVDGSGGVATYHVSQIGSYAFPWAMQQSVWTVANGFTGAIANGSRGKVFDANHAGWYIVSGGTGTGAEFSISSWEPDFSGAQYQCGAALIGDTYIDSIDVKQAGTAVDGTYGSKWEGGFCGLNFQFNNLTGGGGTYGYVSYGAADIHGGRVNPVNAVTGVKLEKGGSIQANVIVDTPTKDCLEADAMASMDGTWDCFEPAGSPALTGTAGYVFGGDTTYSGSTAKFTNALLSLHGTNLGAPLAFIDYSAGGNSFNLVAANSTQSNAAAAHQIPNLVSFGTHNTAIGNITGTIDRVAKASTFTGTVPNDGIMVENSQDGVWVTGNGNYQASSTASAFDLSANITAMTLPLGTTGQRPTGANGMIRYNSTTPTVEAYVGGAWTALGGSSITWPASGSVVVSNTTNTPAGIAEVDGDCIVGAAGSWGAGGCAGTITLGTSSAATNPQRSGEAATGLFSAATKQVGINVQATNPILFGQNASHTTYGIISLNNSNSDSALSGLIGGGDSNLYVQAGGAGGVVIRQNGVTIGTFSGSALNLPTGLKYQINSVDILQGGMQILPSSYYTTDTAGNLFPNVYAGGGGNASSHDSGWGVAASLGSDVTLELRFQMPSKIPDGTFKLVSYCLANANSGVVKYTVSDADVANAASPSAATLTAETQTSITWAAADVYVVTKTTLTSVPAVNDVSVAAVKFQTSGWTLAQPLTCRFSEIWE